MTWLALSYFYVCAALAVSGALAVVVAKNAIRAAMGLLLLILSLAGLFLSLRAQFLAVIQLIVYAGAVVVLFLFVIMLLGPSADPPHDHRGRVVRGIGATVFGLSMFAAIWPMTVAAHMHPLVPATADFGSIDTFGWSLFNGAIVPFELSSALLMVAVIGAVAVARGRQGEPAHTRPSSQPGLSPQLTSPLEGGAERSLEPGEGVKTS
jgi:NADH-quinone oxidoreductase subunit J